MARPSKATVDYFPLMCELNDNIKTIENLYGNDGFVVWIKLLQKLGRTENHIIDVSNPVKWKIFYSIFGVEEEKAKTIINELSEFGCIDSEFWKHKIIYSQNFVDNVTDAYRNRKVKLYSRDELLEIYNVRNTSETRYCGVSDVINPVSNVINPQIKLNKIKLNKKEEETKSASTSTTQSSFDSVLDEEIEDFKKSLKNWHGPHKNVHLTEKQYGKLLAITQSTQGLSLAIEQLSENIAAKNDKAQPYDDTFPDMHFIAVKRYWTYIRKNPDKFKQTKTNNGENENEIERSYNGFA